MLTALPKKIIRHLKLLRDDPERFAANLLQFTNPQRFQEKLLDIWVAAPLNVRFDPALAARPTLNVLQPVLSPEHMTGGPNTIVNFAFRVAQLVGGLPRPPGFEAASAADPAQPLPIGRNDIFMATHWITAQQVKYQLPAMNIKKFIYLIQDFEPGFHQWSNNYALASETYELDFIAVFNEQFLLDYFAHG